MEFSKNVEKNPRIQDVEDNWSGIYNSLKVCRHYEVRDSLIEIKKRDFMLFNALYHRVDDWLKGYCGRGELTKNEIISGLDCYEVGGNRFLRIIGERTGGIWDVMDLPWIMPKVFNNEP